MPFSHFQWKLKHSLISGTKKLFKALGLGIVTNNNLQILQDNAGDRSRKDLDFIYSFESDHYKNLLVLLKASRSQLRQDLFVLAESNYKENGYFVEFGAANGIHFSNTYLLAREFSWYGILAEPAKVWKGELVENRPEALIETLCVWKESDVSITFHETENPELSTLEAYRDTGWLQEARSRGKKYEVKTISLIDLLRKYAAPRYIDYLSIDTEGSEYEILCSFDFEEYSFGIITVEHNFSLQREKVYNLLTEKGYRRKFENISSFDDWYTK